MWKFFFLYSLFKCDEKNKDKTNEEIEKEIELEREKFKEMREFESDIEYSKLRFKSNLIKLGMIIFIYFIFLFYASLSKIPIHSFIEGKEKISFFIDKTITAMTALTFMNILFFNNVSNKASKLMICLVLTIFLRIVFHFL